MSHSTTPMRVVRGMSQSFCSVLLLLTCGGLSGQNEEHRVRNIVLVHGAWADGAGWQGVHDIFIARSQVPNAADNFKAVIATPAWRGKPSWMLVAGADRTINPDLERWYATRANSHKVEVPGASHSVYVSRPKEVAAVIEQAALHAR